jgi:hypothetical protein
VDVKQLTDQERAVLKKWNWGAATLQWIWGMGHGVYWMSFVAFLLSLIPLAGAILPFFIFGSHGNQWAWEKGHWRDIRHFERVQRLWTYWGFGISGILIVCAVFLMRVHFHRLMENYRFLGDLGM